MAERRMFAKTVIDCDMFLDMPQSARLLYYDLSMRADDDGFITPKKVMRMTGASNDDLQILIAKKFVIPFDSGVVVIKHWRINNYLRNDRYKETIFIDEKSKLNLDEKKEYELSNDTGIPNGYQMDTKWIPNGYTGKDRDSIGKVSIGKSIEKEITAEAVKEKEQPQPLRIKLKNQTYYITEEDIRDFQRMYNGTVDVRSEAISCCAYYDEHQCSATSWQVALTKWISRSKLYRQIDTASAIEQRRDSRRPPLEDKIIEGEDAGL